MTEKTYREALTDALFLEMRRDENVFIMGEDVVGGTGSPHAEPGFVGVMPAMGEIRTEPVSVCHHVSITSQDLLPTTE